MGDVKSRDSYSKNLVGRLGDIPLDSFLVHIAKNRGHGVSTLTLNCYLEAIVGG